MLHAADVIVGPDGILRIRNGCCLIDLLGMLALLVLGLASVVFTVFYAFPLFVLRYWHSIDPATKASLLSMIGALPCINVAFLILGIIACFRNLAKVIYPKLSMGVLVLQMVYGLLAMYGWVASLKEMDMSWSLYFLMCWSSQTFLFLFSLYQRRILRKVFGGKY